METTDTKVELDSTLPPIKIRVTRQYTLDGESNARDAFWEQGTTSVRANKDAFSIEEHERFLESDFGDQILYKLMEFSESKVANGFYDLENRLKANQIKIKRIKVKTKIIGYGSIELGVFIYGLPWLAAIFDNNFEYFLLFLDKNLPAAFVQSSRMSIDDRSLDYEISTESNFVKKFNSKPTESNQTKAIPSTRLEIYEKWMRAGLKNGILIIPLIFLYALVSKMYVELKNEKTALEQARLQMYEVVSERLEMEQVKSSKLEAVLFQSLDRMIDIYSQPVRSSPRDTLTKLPIAVK